MIVFDSLINLYQLTEISRIFVSVQAREERERDAKVVHLHIIKIRTLHLPQTKYIPSVYEV